MHEKEHFLTPEKKETKKLLRKEYQNKSSPNSRILINKPNAILQTISHNSKCLTKNKISYSKISKTCSLFDQIKERAFKRIYFILNRKCDDSNKYFLHRVIHSSILEKIYLLILNQ